MDFTSSFYSKPSYSGGGVIFSGARRQRGGSIFGAFKSVILPALKTVGRKLGRIASKGALGLASDVISDTISGKNVKQSVIQRGKQHLADTANEGLSTIGNLLLSPTKRPRTRRSTKRKNQRGSGYRSRSRNRSTSRKRSISHKKLSSRKRRTTRSKSTFTKRRRTANY